MVLSSSYALGMGFKGCFSLLFLSTLPWHIETGYSRLAREAYYGCDLSIKTGVTQVEAPVNGNYLPESGEGEFNGSGLFASTQFTAKSGPSDVSPHAENMAEFFRGLPRQSSESALSPSDSALSQVAASNVTAAPTPLTGLRSVSVYKVDGEHFLMDDFLRTGSDYPRIEKKAVQNHSWIGLAGTATSSLLNEFLYRMDYAIARDGFSSIVAVDNFDTTTIPPLLASAYNVVCVGRSDGNHSRGDTPDIVNGAGRLKPDIVAPLRSTSAATAAVTSVATLLHDQIAGQHALQAAAHPEVIKALLIAGATKTEFPEWSNSPERPLDPVYGAGEVNVAHSSEILHGGLYDPGKNEPTSAWDHRPLPSQGNSHYQWSLAQGGHASIALTWLRQVKPGGQTFAKATAKVADLNLCLHRIDPNGDKTIIGLSDSPIDNVEYLYLEDLEPGQYELIVEGAPKTKYGLAWRFFQTTQIHTDLISLSSTASTLFLHTTGLQDGRSYEIETSSDLIQWDSFHSFAAQDDVYDWEANSTISQGFFRITELRQEIPEG
ncbi:MAG: hypothetical protein AAF514_04905 [Verrucomicrobiota bacterium]